MSQPDTKSALEQGAAASLWRRTISQIPSLFGRLVYLCSLRDSNRGVYEHFGLAQAFGDAETDRALRFSHEQTFQEWLCLKLEAQKADLELYLSSLEGHRREILDTWIRLQPYRNLMPGAARQVERELYMSDLETILALLKSEHGVSEPDPDA